MTGDALIELICGLAGAVFFVIGLLAIAETSERGRERRLGRN